MKKSVLVVILILVALILAGLLVVMNRMRKPLGPALELTGVTAMAPTTTRLFPTPDETVFVTPSSILSETAFATPSSTPLSSPARKICRGEGQVNLLVLGLASPENAYQRGAGAIRLVRVDFERQSLAMLALPPTLRVNAPEPITLAQVYWEARQDTPGAENVRNHEATRVLAQALLDNYGYVPDHYITIDQSSFVQMVDRFGGIVVEVPEAIQQVPEGWHTFEAGKQTLNGDQVLDFVRLINAAEPTYLSEGKRIERQNLVIQAAINAALQPTNWIKLPGLIRDFGNLLVTDLSTDQLLDLACIARQVGGKARLLELPAQAVSNDEQWRMVVDPAVVRALIDDLADEQTK